VNVKISFAFRHMDVAKQFSYIPREFRLWRTACKALY
jgi:hypothetical protein